MQVVPRTLGRAPILVVDDDPKIVHLVRMYLEREGFDVVAAADGVSAIAAIRERAPRLLVLDVMLPGLDGFSVLRAARVDSDVPVLDHDLRERPAAENERAEREHAADEQRDRSHGDRDLSAEAEALHLSMTAR